MSENEAIRMEIAKTVQEWHRALVNINLTGRNAEQLGWLDETENSSG